MPIWRLPHRCRCSRLSRRDRLVGISCRQGMVPAAEVAPLFPSAAGRAPARPHPGFALRGPGLLTGQGHAAGAGRPIIRQEACVTDRLRQEGGQDPGLRALPHHPARCHSRGAGAAFGLYRGRLSRHHGVDAGDARTPLRPAGAMGRRALHRHVRHELRPRSRPALPSGQAGQGRDLGLCPQSRLSRRDEGPAQGDRHALCRAGPAPMSRSSSIPRR